MSHADILVKVARAVQRGTLPSDITINSYGRSGIEMNMIRSSSWEQEFAAERRVLAWLARNFGAAGTRRRHGAHQRGYGRQKKWYDTVIWSSKAGEVRFAYSMPHECQEYIGNATKDGPSWRCVACRQVITKTRARELGLLPRR